MIGKCYSLCNIRISNKTFRLVGKSFIALYFALTSATYKIENGQQNICKMPEFGF
jgi:hypothetical protein